MGTLNNGEARPATGRATALAALVLSLAALAAAVLWGRAQLRDQMRAQIVGRDAQILNALAVLELERVDREDNSRGAAIDAAAQYEVLLNVARLTNIIAARLFGPAGDFLAGVPNAVTEARLPRAVLAELHGLRPVTSFRADQPRADLFLLLPDDSRRDADLISWVEVDIPLHEPGSAMLVGVAQFILEGASAEHEFALLDQRLNLQSALVFSAGGLVIFGGLAWAFRRLERANHLLAARTADLQKANRELAQAAKVSAIGAVTAHLIHSLKNPVAGLHSFVAAQQDANAPDGAEWREAAAATRRMNHLIQQVVQVLRDQQGEAAFELSLAEFEPQVAVPARAAAEAKGVRLESTCSGTAVLDNREAGLLRLILANLLQNALEASPPGSCVALELRATPDALIAEVRDAGGGISADLRGRLFEPVRSHKEGGSGIGLAITRQLATYLGAEVELAATSPDGSMFRVTLPRNRH